MQNKLKKLREKTKLKRHTTESLNAYYDDKRIALHAFTSEIYQLEPSKGTYNLGMSIRVAKLSDRSGLKILTAKQMPERLPIAISKLKGGNTSENVQNEIRQIIHKINY